MKIIAIVGDILNDDDFFGDVVDTPKEGTEQHKKRKELKRLKDRGKLGQNRHMERWTRQAMKLLTKRTLNTSSVN